MATEQTTYYYWVKASCSNGDSDFSIYDSGLQATSRKNLGAAVADDWNNPPNVWKDDVVNFANTLTSQQGWNQSFVNGAPDRTWWQEETPNGPADGQDDTKADNCELALLMTHGADTSPISQIAFPVNGWLDDPTTVRLGYASPDNRGYNIWNFFIACYILKDSSYPYWQSILDGSHMVMGFVPMAQLYANDLQELSYYLTGTGGKAKLNIQNAFFNTYLRDPGGKSNHLLNVGRILAQNSDVADNDYIDFFNPQISTGGTQIVITCNPW